MSRLPKTFWLETTFLTNPQILDPITLLLSETHYFERIKHSFLFKELVCPRLFAFSSVRLCWFLTTRRKPCQCKDIEME